MIIPYVISGICISNSTLICISCPTSFDSWMLKLQSNCVYCKPRLVRCSAKFLAPCSWERYVSCYLEKSFHKKHSNLFWFFLSFQDSRIESDKHVGKSIDISNRSIFFQTRTYHVQNRSTFQCFMPEKPSPFIDNMDWYLTDCKNDKPYSQNVPLSSCLQALCRRAVSFHWQHGLISGGL